MARSLVEDSLAGLLYGLFAVDDGAAVDVHVVGHAVVDGGVGGDFEGWGGFAAEDGAAAGGEADDIGSAGDLAGGGDGIEAGRVHEDEAGGVDGFGVEVDLVEVGGAAFGDGAEGFFEDGG